MKFTLVVDASEAAQDWDEDEVREAIEENLRSAYVAVESIELIEGE